MNYSTTATRRTGTNRKARRTALLLAALSATGFAGAQTINAALSGIVTDKSGARVTRARVTLTNQDSKSVRTTVTDKAGVYNFAAVPTGTYTEEVRGVGFGTTSLTGIELHPGDAKTLPDVVLNPGDEASITVTASDNAFLDSGERSAIISQEDIQHLSVQGRDVTELLRILPGFALQAGGTQNGAGISNNTGINQGVSVGSKVSNYAANGAPETGIGLISDGANIQDPGIGGAGTQTINMDMVSEVKVSTSNFGAESAKGPIVVNAVGKSGGANYHGSLYIVSNISQFNSQDSLANAFKYQKPTDRYLYPGFNIGGPVLIPGTSFNHNKKLTFFIGGEDYVQRNTFSGGSFSSALRLSSVPSDAMRGGDFSAASLASWLNVPLNSAGTAIASCGTAALANLSNVCAVPTGVDVKNVPIVNGKITNIDPGAAALLKIFPHGNRTPQAVPGGSLSDGFNRQDLYLFNNNLYQARGRMDYSFSDNTKLYGVYNIQRGNSYNPFTLYYNPSYNQGILQDPSLIENTTNSQTGTLNFTHVFTPTLTNEVFFASSFYNNPYFSLNQSVQTKEALAYPYGSLLNNTTDQLPNLGYGTALPLYQGPDFSNGTIFARKFSLDGGDNLTKTLGGLTLKLGVYAERQSNNQKTPFAATQGSLAEYGTYAGPNIKVDPSVNAAGYVTTNPGNSLANFYLGFVNGYQQQNSQPIQDMNYLVVDGYISGSYKATKKLTLDLGVRFDHLGPWEDTRNLGLATFRAAAYGSTYGTKPYSVTAGTFPGVSYHGLDAGVPKAGRPTVAAFVSPRAGFAYDFLGNGRTVVRGGWGAYRSPDSWNAYSVALGTSEGAFIGNVNNTTLRCIDASGKGLLTTASTAAAGAYADCAGISAGGTTTGPTITQGTTAISAVDPTDSQMPVTYTYSMTVSQELPGHSHLEIGYAGNQSAHLLVSNGQNINTIPFGGLFRPDPNPQSVYYGQVSAPNSMTQSQQSDYRQFPFYSAVNLIRHGLHSNYNALQVTWNKQSGRILYGLNYTWSKAEGDLAAAGSNNVPDPTNFRNDRGILSFDRTNIFNASYTLIVGSPWHGNALVGGVVNGWEVSGITNLQSGPNLQSAVSTNFNLQNLTLNGNNATTTNNLTYLGTPDIALQPVLTCNPTGGVSGRQYVNASCFALPTPGNQGQYRYPYIHGPAYFTTDLSAQKSFHMAEKREIQLRFSAFNFVNHPLPSLYAGGTATPLQLTLSPVAGQSVSPGFGTAQYTEGRRVTEITLRFNF